MFATTSLHSTYTKSHFIPDMPHCVQLLGGWAFCETAFFHTSLPFAVLSQPYTANNNGVFLGSGPQFARRAPGIPLYRMTPYPGVTIAGTRQWAKPGGFRLRRRYNDRGV
jgi:hypothetical protein